MPRLYVTEVRPELAEARRQSAPSDPALTADDGAQILATSPLGAEDGLVSACSWEELLELRTLPLPCALCSRPGLEPSGHRPALTVPLPPATAGMCQVRCRPPSQGTLSVFL